MGSPARFLVQSLLLFVLGGAFASAQTPALITAAEGQGVLTVGNAAALVGVAAGSLPLQTDPAGAADQLRKIGFTVSRAPSTAPITIGEYSYLVMQLLDIRGGLMYSIFPGPRYAVQELVVRGILPKGTQPGEHLSGAEGLRILGMLLRRAGGTP